MKAINLLPTDARRSFGAVRGTSGGTVVLFGALTVALVFVVAYVLLVNDVRSKRSDLARVTEQVNTAQHQVANLKPYADLDQLRQSLLQQVRTVADSRYDWPGMLDRIARALPANTTLTEFNGSAGDDASSSSGPSISLAGCTPSHDAVANVIDRLRAVKGVDGVSLQSSTLKTPGSADSAGGCPQPESFSMTVQLKGVAVAPAATTGATPGSTPAASTPSTTTPAAPATPATGGTTP